MKRSWLVVVIALLVLVVFMMVGRKPDLKQFDKIREMNISEKASQTMLVAEVKGDPATSLKQGYAYLFRKLMTLRSEGKPLRMTGGPRARYPLPFNTPKEEWVTLLAIPVPEKLDTPVIRHMTNGVDIRVETWRYGEVAEMLHLGPYSEEPRTVEAMLAKIKEKGYILAGPHEEEYIVGPGFGLFVRPRNYVTIIRYEVRRK